jgi:hypothetical protein
MISPSFAYSTRLFSFIAEKKPVIDWLLLAYYRESHVIEIVQY